MALVRDVSKVKELRLSVEVGGNYESRFQTPELARKMHKTVKMHF